MEIKYYTVLKRYFFSVTANCYFIAKIICKLKGIIYMVRTV